LRRAAAEWTAATAAVAAPVAPAAESSAEVCSADAAAALGLMPRRVRQLCQSGQLPGRKDRRGRWWVPVDALRE
jgi:hypothetical protein